MPLLMDNFFPTGYKAPSASRVIDTDTDEGARELYAHYKDHDRPVPYWLKSKMEAMDMRDYTPKDEGEPPQYVINQHLDGY